MNMDRKPILLCVFFAIALVIVACSDNNADGGSNDSRDGESSSSDGGQYAGPYIYFPGEQKPGVVDTRYQEWKAIYYRTMEQELALDEEEEVRKNSFSSMEGAQGSARIRFQADDNCKVNGSKLNGVCTVSEGIGYGMLIAFFQDEEEVFRKLWKYSKYRQGAAGTNYLMNWKFRTFVYGANSDGSGSATDADLDVATALILGYRKWHDQEMLANALQIAGEIWEKEIRENNKLIMPGNTPMWINADSYNPSYFSPVAFRLFAEYDQGHNWNSVLDANYNWMENISARGNLVPDWANAEGVPAVPPNNSAPSTYKQYYYESVRVPWRLAWDQAWYGEQRAKTILTRFANFVIEQTGGDPAKISNRYNYEFGSQPNNNAVSMAHRASLCATGVTSPDYVNWLNACNAIVVDTKITGFSYFHHILQVMYAQLLNGKYVKP